LDGNISAPTPEALMRARYSAHVLGKTKFLITSLHPSVRGGIKESDLKAPDNDALAWQGLTIEETKDDTGDGKGEVVFIAKYAVHDKANEHREHAYFQKDNGQWFYMDGDVDGHTPYRRDSPKVNRNDPCPCGSGKKYKKCCGSGA
jgi:SEC-C motif-containing protein